MSNHAQDGFDRIVPRYDQAKVKLTNGTVIYQDQVDLPITDMLSVRGHVQPFSTKQSSARKSFA